MIIHSLFRAQCPDWDHVLVIAYVNNLPSKLRPHITESALDTTYEDQYPMWIHKKVKVMPSSVSTSLGHNVRVWSTGSHSFSSVPLGQTWVIGQPGDTIHCYWRSTQHPEFSFEFRDTEYDCIYWCNKGEWFRQTTEYPTEPNAYSMTLSEESFLIPTIDQAAGSTAYRRLCQFETDWDPGALSARALKNYQGLSINTASYIKEVPTIVATLRDALSLFRKGIKGDVKALASSYLAAKYGTLNTIRDTMDVMKYVRSSHNKAYTSLHGSASLSRGCESYTLTARDTCTIRTNPITPTCYQAASNFLRSIDLAPSLANAWDAIPYSFVIDWMVPIGDFLSSIDYNRDLSRLSVKDASYSRLIEYNTQSPFGVISCSSFSRYTCGEAVCPVGVDSYSSDDVSNHFLEASALIVQRTN